MKLKVNLFSLALIFLVSCSSAMADCRIKTVTVLGDSLVAGYGLQPGEAFPERLGEYLKRQGHDVLVRNAGVSGDTTSGGLVRLDWAIGEDTDLVILELGANDALRGISADITSNNLNTIITRLKARGTDIILAGMMAPPNMGPEYGKAFNAIYPNLSEKHGIALYPFFLDGVAANPELNQPDGMHPTGAGVQVIVDRFAPLITDHIGKSCEN